MQHDKEVDAHTSMKQELFATRRELRQMRDAHAATGDAAGALAVARDAERFEQLTARNGLLESQNVRLKKAGPGNAAAATALFATVPVPTVSTATLTELSAAATQEIDLLGMTGVRLHSMSLAM
jgi:hypothetical protein